MNGSYIVLTNDVDDRKVFFMFLDGDVRDMTKGFGELLTCDEFKKTYDNLINEGYKENTEVRYKF